MTAEERAEGTADEMRDECDDDVSMAGREIIAKHIAAAEDEALERAAVRFRAAADAAERGERWLTGPLAGASVFNVYAFMARELRAFKSGPGVSGKDGGAGHE